MPISSRVGGAFSLLKPNPFNTMVDPAPFPFAPPLEVINSGGCVGCNTPLAAAVGIGVPAFVFTMDIGAEGVGVPMDIGTEFTLGRDMIRAPLGRVGRVVGSTIGSSVPWTNVRNDSCTRSEFW